MVFSVIRFFWRLFLRERLCKFIVTQRFLKCLFAKCTYMCIALFTYLDECCQLSSQLIIPDIGLSLPARGLASPILFNQLPLQVAY